MEIKCSEDHKRIIKESLKIVNEFNRGNFKPYMDTLSHNIKMTVDKRMNIEHSILVGQAMLNKEFEEDKNIELNNYGVGVLSAYKKAQNNEYDFNDNELSAISVAVENYARISLGQLNYGRDLLMSGFHHLEAEKFVQIAECFDFANNKLDCHYGIHNNSVSEDARTAWDMYQVVRNYVSWKNNPDGGIGANYDTPMRVGIRDLIQIEGHEYKERQINKKSKGSKPSF